MNTREASIPSGRPAQAPGPRWLLRRWRAVRGPSIPLCSTQTRALAEHRQRLAQGRYQRELARCLCGAERGWLLAKRDRYGLSVHTHLCRRCGQMWTSPRLDAASLARFYAEEYRTIYAGHRRPADEFFQEQVIHGQQVLQLAQRWMDASCRRIFDIGCGAGGMLRPFQQRGCEVFGCDFDAAYLDYGRVRGLCLETGPATGLARHGPADLVILSHVLEHLPDPAAALAQWAGLVRPGTLAYVELPGIYNIHRPYAGNLMAFLQNAHLYHFTLAGLRRLMAGQGWELVRGDQRIRALFRYSGQARVLPVTNESRRVLAYLGLCELTRRGPACCHLAAWEPALRLVARAWGKGGRLVTGAGERLRALVGQPGRPIGQEAPVGGR